MFFCRLKIQVMACRSSKTRLYSHLTTTAGKPRMMKRSRYEIYDGPIVITGISGRFPMSANMEEFKNNLFTCVDMTRDGMERWDNKEHPERFGFLSCSDEFDANFFSMTPSQADHIDPQMRLLLEVTFEAMLDAGETIQAHIHARTPTHLVFPITISLRSFLNFHDILYLDRFESYRTTG